MTTEIPEHRTLPTGMIAHFDDATRAWWEVSADEWRELLAALESGAPDAYSHWCNESSARQISAEDAEAMGLD